MDVDLRLSQMLMQFIVTARTVNPCELDKVGQMTLSYVGTFRLRPEGLRYEPVISKLENRKMSPTPEIEKRFICRPSCNLTTLSTQLWQPTQILTVTITWPSCPIRCSKIFMLYRASTAEADVTIFGFYCTRAGVWGLLCLSICHWTWARTQIQITLPILIILIQTLD